MKSIKIKSNGLGRYDDVSPFIIESGALELTVELPAKSGEFYFVAENNSKCLGATLISCEGTIALENLQAGELKAAVKHYLRGELIEVFKVEPLLLKEVEKELSAMPEIALLEGKISELRKQLDELTETVTDYVATTEEGFAAVTQCQRASDTAFLSFAYVVYENSPLLNARGLTFAEFAETLGFEGIEQTNLKEKL